MNQFQFNFIIDKQLIRIVQILEQFQQFSVCSTAELTEVTGASYRTILGDIKEIKDYFENSIALDSSNTGYSFTIINKQKYLELKRYLSKEEPLFKIIESIFFNEIYSLNEWSEKLHITRTSLARYINKIRPTLSKYELYITTTKVDIIGDEINIRHFFHDFFYQSDITSHTVIPSIEAQEIAMSLRKEHFFQEYSKISFFDFNYIIFITLERFIKGNNIIVFSKDKLFLKNELLKHMKLINLSHVKEMIKIFYNVELTDEERTYMYILLISRRSIESLEAEENFIKHFSYWPETIYLAEELIHRFEIRGERKKEQLFFLILFLQVYF